MLYCTAKLHMAYVGNTVIIEGIAIKLHKSVSVAFKVICNQKTRKYLPQKFTQKSYSANVCCFCFCSLKSHL